MNTITSCLTTNWLQETSARSATYRPLLSLFFDLLLPIDRTGTRLAVDLHVIYEFRTPDALHAATAMVSNTKVYITSQRSKSKVSQLGIVTLGDYAPRDTPSRW